MTKLEKEALLIILETVEENMKINLDRLPFYLKNVNDPDFPFLQDLTEEQVALFHAGVYVGLKFSDELLTTYFC